MSSSSEQRSPIVRFFETFFQEQNIKWMLGVGMMIMIGSSLMLVTSHWDAYTPLWKSVILLGYTVGVHIAGQVSFHSLALRKTGTVLMALTVLLIPLGFHALRWNFSEDFGQQTASLLLLAGNGVFATLAARRIFEHFLRSSQPTFLASYGILSVAAALLPAVPLWLAPWTALLLWGVFAVGAIKVNRHVFWLTEEHRLPRIVGFFPILLLGGQFLTLFVTSIVNSTALVDAIPVEWIGFGMVLTAIPVLLTADALARVFLQVHGKLARPLPLGIVIPILNGLVLIAVGVFVSAIGFPNAVALVPASALAAVMMAVVARRTGKSAFVWAMLGGVLMAYQCSPVFFRELAGQVVQHGAAAVSETRLPIAFYGLTYLPLLVIVSLVARQLQKADDDVFAVPMRRFAVGMGIVLLAVSVTHVKAVFLVSLAAVALFGLQSWLFKSRRIVALGVVAWVMAMLSCETFLIDVVKVSASNELGWLTLVAGAAGLLLPGRFIDRRIANWPVTGKESVDQRAVSSQKSRESIDKLAICETTSRWTTAILAAVWIAVSAVSLSTVAGASGCLIAALLFVHAWRAKTRWTADVALGFTICLVSILAVTMPLPIATIFSIVAVLLFGLWGVVPRVGGRISATFGDAATRVASLGFLLMGLGVLVPAWAIAMGDGHTFGHWVAAALANVWLFDAARKYQAAWLVVIGWLTILANTGVMAVEGLAGHSAIHWLPAIWSAVSVFVVLAGRFRNSGRSNVNRASTESLIGGWAIVADTLHGCTLATLGLTATVSLLFFSFPIRVAGGASLLGLLLIAGQRNQPIMRTVALMLVSWQVLYAAIQVFVPEVATVFDLSIAILQPAFVPVSLLASILLMAWQYGTTRVSNNLNNGDASPPSSEAAELAALQRVLLRVVIGGSLTAILFASTFSSLSTSSAAIVAAAFLMLAGDCLVSGFRLNRKAIVDRGNFMGNINEYQQTNQKAGAQGRVWGAIAIVAAGVCHLAFCGVITFGHGLSMFVVLGAGLAAWGVSQLAARSSNTEFLTQPLAITGLCLPAVTVGIGVGRHLADRESIWLGMNSLALLMSAAFYFWRGLERRNSSMLAGSAVVLNVALTLLWNELSWSDPQFFMIPLGVSLLGLVELLRSEIPTKVINPLRYAAALVILVSPTFHIVGGSWLHLFSLMVASVGVTLLAMGLRIRALMYTGVGFLVADLIAMMVRGSIDNPSILWIAGITFGTLVIALAAYCERHREKLLQRMRLVASELDAWE
jgi:hypothetical protein